MVASVPGSKAVSETPRLVTVFPAVDTIGPGELDRVVTIRLAPNGLAGVIPIPTELGSISGLELLLLDYNNLTGEIPRSFGNLAMLGVLFLAGNALEGPIPREFGNLERLEQPR